MSDIIKMILTIRSYIFAQDRGGKSLWSKIDQLAAKVEKQVISWRRDIHQHSELSNREVHFSTGRGRSARRNMVSQLCDFA